MPSNRTFKYVYIPADNSDPIQQFEESMEEGKEVESLLDRLKSHFRKTGPTKTTAQLNQQRHQLLQTLPQGATVDQRMLDIATSLNMVETVSLLSHTRDHKFVAINLYVDDEGMVKNLPINKRASEIAQCAGNPIEVRGDAFLARVLDDGDNFDRLDFTIDEISSNAEWVQHAQIQNAKRRSAEASGHMAQRLQTVKEEGTRLRELTPAEVEKEEGNTCFARQDWTAALDHYSRAIQHDDMLLAARNNRAMTYLKLHNWEAARHDTDTLLELQPGNVKALMRRAAALQGLGRGEEAKVDLLKVMELEPHNKEAKQQLNGL